MLNYIKSYFKNVLFFVKRGLVVEESKGIDIEKKALVELVVIKKKPMLSAEYFSSGPLSLAIAKDILSSIKLAKLNNKGISIVEFDDEIMFLSKGYLEKLEIALLTYFFKKKEEERPKVTYPTDKSRGLRKLQLKRVTSIK